MHLTISSDTLAVLKHHLRVALPSVGSSLRLEAFARGCGFRTYGGLRSAIDRGPLSVTPDDSVFLEFLNQHEVVGYPPQRLLPRLIARSSLDRILDLHPTLTERGFDSIWRGNPEERSKPREERVALLAARRRHAYESANAGDQFELALVFLSRQERIKTINGKMGSYGLKHRAEDISRKFGLFRDLGDYVSNGMLLAAAYAAGFTVVPDGGHSPNGSLNISMRTINRSRGRDRRHRDGDSDRDHDPAIVLEMYGVTTRAAA